MTEAQTKIGGGTVCKKNGQGVAMRKTKPRLFGWSCCNKPMAWRLHWGQREKNSDNYGYEIKYNTTLEYIRNIMQSTNVTADSAMNILYIPSDECRLYLSALS